MILGMEVSLGPGDFVLDGTQLLSPKRAEPPIFDPYLLWPSGWVDKMPLGKEIGLGPGDIVLVGDPAPPPPIFGPCLLWPNGWMDQDAPW